MIDLTDRQADELREAFNKIDATFDEMDRHFDEISKVTSKILDKNLDKNFEDAKVTLVKNNRKNAVIERIMYFLLGGLIGLVIQRFL